MCRKIGKYETFNIGIKSVTVLKFQQPKSYFLKLLNDKNIET
jgi:hypothetical protein